MIRIHNHQVYFNHSNKNLNMKFTEFIIKSNIDRINCIILLNTIVIYAFYFFFILSIILEVDITDVYSNLLNMPISAASL